MPAIEVWKSADGLQPCTECADELGSVHVADGIRLCPACARDFATAIDAASYEAYDEDWP